MQRPASARDFVPAANHTLLPEAREIVVGGKKQWTLGVSTWKPTPTVKAGDVLVFQWGAYHDVWQMSNVAAYKGCNFQAASQKAPATLGGKYKFTVPASAKGKVLYFACRVSGHCGSKMKVAISVQS
ncbi:unnamed protein product [Closterium sp. NIES-54]